MEVDDKIKKDIIERLDKLDEVVSDKIRRGIIGKYLSEFDTSIDDAICSTDDGQVTIKLEKCDNYTMESSLIFCGEKSGDKNIVIRGREQSRGYKRVSYENVKGYMENMGDEEREFVVSMLSRIDINELESIFEE